ncbi:hypothetical protein CTheo_7447 [Ceratobasidium theobromae]|uniref:Uncharacterized protein n=1 Tax=Ceratobasidium theobromae TaxID=1582974 RepID=A0A5N5QCE4_9AGAM|nr:hypothetical protein CTheo_7447 [Ceratobasidium theobromae]
MSKSEFKVMAIIENFKPENWTDAELMRVHFYGPFVKTLLIRGPTLFSMPYFEQPAGLVDIILEAPLGGLIYQYLKSHDIFPNLHTIWGLGKSPLRFPGLEWELCLAPTSLRVLEIGPLLPHQNGKKQNPNLFAEAIIEKCPGLEVLDLYSAEFSTGDIFADFPLLLGLRELRVVSPLVNSTMLEWASKLPMLQTLEIHTHRYISLAPPQQNLKGEIGPFLFNSLLTLKVAWDREDQMGYFLEHCYFPHLVELSVKDYFIPLSPRKHSFGSRIAFQSPKIKRIAFETITKSWRVGYRGLIEWLEKFQRLDLSELHFDINVDYPGPLQMICNHILKYWPRIERLSWENQAFIFQDVAETISYLPHLVSLSFRTMRGPWTEPSIQALSHLASAQPLRLRCYFADRHNMDADEVARWLKKIRPNIQYEIYLESYN